MTFGNGWVELPGANRESALVRGKVRVVGKTLLACALALGVLLLMNWLIGVLDLTGPWVHVLPVVLSIALLGLLTYFGPRQDWRDLLGGRTRE